MRRLCLAIVALFFSPALTQADETTAFRHSLLSGESLDHWHVTGCEAAIENGSLVLKSGDGFVRSRAQYGDFVLELDYKPRQADKYDSGIYIRCEAPSGERPWPAQYQVNLKQGDELNLIKFPQARSTGLVKPGDWNHIKVTAIHDSVELEINGQRAWKTSGLQTKVGYIGFQSEVPLGGQFEFKNIVVTELTHRPLFDGLSLAGWEGAGEPAERCWQVSEGTIECTGEKGPWLRSAQEHGDFNLRLEYKLKAGGNSGVYVRVPKDGDHHGDGAGVEIQLLDDAAEKYRALKPYQYTGSIYAVAPATEHVGRAVGEWNSLELNCRGTAYHVIHNGVTIISADETTHPELKGRLQKGFLGLQNHSEQVWFRDLRIGPALELKIEPQAPVKADVGQLGEALLKKVLADGTPQRDVETFCAARILRMPGPGAPERSSPEAWKSYADGLRQQVLDRVVFRGRAAEWRENQGQVEWLGEIAGGEGYRIKRLRFEAVPGMWVPALLYEPATLAGKAPVFLNVNGHDGAGKAAEYKQIRCINMAKRGIIALNLEWFGMGQLKSPGNTHYRLNQIDLCGTSGVSPFYLAMKRGIDILLTHPHADPERVGVAGLSGGGWQTIFISSLDPRVTLCNPVAGYSSFLTRIANHSDLGDSEQTPCDLAATADYAHLTAMLAPRVALLTFNEKDNCCFAAPHALPPLLEAARPIYKLLQAEGTLHKHINYDPGNHNFERDNREALYRTLGVHWFSGDAAFSGVEIDASAEVRKPDELTVELPADNLNLQKLAESLMADLPRSKQPSDGQSSAEWQLERKAALRETLRLGSGDAWPKVEMQKTAEANLGLIHVVHARLRIGSEWTVPAVELTPPMANGTTIVIADEGRAAAAETIGELLAGNRRVVALDPFYFGESKIKSRDFLFGLLVSSVGQRPLGVQVEQLAAVAAWLKQQSPMPVRIAAVGPRTSVMALAATALCDDLAGASLTGSFGSLKEAIEQGKAANEMPELFCFGLLETTDIRQLMMLAAPREIKLGVPSDRARSELAGLAGWYELCGKAFDPLAP